MIELVAFLGNLGKEYENTRHNTPWLFEKSLAFSEQLSWQERFKSEFCPLSPQVLLLLKAQADAQLYFQKPLTYMNSSGEAVSEAARFYKIPPEHILIVHDEIELPLGTVSLKFSGGLGGHNGLRSLKAQLGTADFWRLRFGISKPSNKTVYDHVLGQFTSEERIALSQIFEAVAPLFCSVLTAKDPSHYIPEWGKKKILA